MPSTVNVLGIFMDNNYLIEPAQSKLTNWEKEPKCAELMADIEMARSSHSSQMEKINEWLGLLNTKTDKSRIERGRSGIAPKVIRRMAEWRYASLSSAFLNERKLFQVNPLSAKDIESAIQTETLLNFQFNTQMDKVKFIGDLVRTAVNEGTVIVRVGWETKTEKRHKEVSVYNRRYADPTEAAQIASIMREFGELMEQQGVESAAELEEFKALPEELRESIKATYETDSFIVAEPTGKTMMETEEVRTVNKPSVKVVNAGSVFIDPTCEGNVKDARFIVQKYTTSYSELLAEGIYDNLEQAFANEDSYPNSYDYIAKELADTSVSFKDKARKRVTAYEYWGYWDIDNSGQTKAIVATIVNNTIIRLEENPFPDKSLPFVVIPYLPVKGSVYGEPDGELIKDNQEIIQALTRSMIDIQARSANAQTGFPINYLDSVNMAKFKRGEDYNYNPNGIPPAQAIYMSTPPEIPSSIFSLFQQQFADVEASTGIKSFLGGIDGSAYGKSMAGMSQALSVLTQREGDILFRMSRGLEEIGSKVVMMNQQWLDEEATVSITSRKFTTVRRDELTGNYYLQVQVKSTTESEGKAQQLTFVAQTLGNNADWGIRKMFFMEICRLYNLDGMLSAIQDYTPEPDPLEQKRIELEIAEMEAKIEKIKAETDFYRSRGEFIEAQVDDVQATTDQRNLDFLEQHDGTKHQRNLETVREQAKAQGESKIAEAIVNHKVNTETPPVKVDGQGRVRLDNLERSLLNRRN